MGRLIFRWFLLSGLMLIFSSAYAHSSSEDRTTPPVNTTPVKMPVPYLSVFSRYRPYQEQPLLPWQEANDKAGEIGGWRFYAREGKQPEKEVKPTEAKPAETIRPATPAMNIQQRHQHGSTP